MNGTGVADWRYKGFPGRAEGMPLARIGKLGLRILAGDCSMPVAILKETALAHNGDWMRRFAAGAGVALCPHGKTTMSPEYDERRPDHRRDGGRHTVPPALVYTGTAVLYLVNDRAKWEDAPPTEG